MMPVSVVKKNVVSFMIFLLILCVSTPLYAQFSNDVLVNDDGTEFDQFIRNGTPSVALVGDTAYCTWFDEREGSDNGYDVYFAMGTVDAAGKISFGTNVRVNDVAKSVKTGHPNLPSIAVSSEGIVYIVWVDGRATTGESDVYFARSTDGGGSFLANQKINPLTDPQNYLSRRSPRVATSGDYVYVTFGKGMTGTLEISISSDKGVTFDPVREIADAAADYSVLAATGNYVYVGHIQDSDAFLKVSTDNGQTFGPSVMINDDGRQMAQKDLSIAATGENLYLVWQDERSVVSGVSGYAIYGAFSQDNGKTFGANRLMSPTDGTTASMFEPSVSASGDMVGVSFHGLLNDYKSVIAMTSMDRGVTWTSETMVSDPYSRPSIGPSSIAVSSTSACVLWEAKGDYSGDPGTGTNIYSAAQRFTAIPTCPEGIPFFTLSDSVLTLPSLCIEGVYYNAQLKIYLDFNTMTFQLK